MISGDTTRVKGMAWRDLKVAMMADDYHTSEFYISCSDTEKSLIEILRDAQSKAGNDLEMVNEEVMFTSKDTQYLKPVKDSWLAEEPMELDHDVDKKAEKERKKLQQQALQEPAKEI